MNQNSIDAYNTIKENGLLSKRRMEVLSAIYEHKEATQNEILRHFRLKRPDIASGSVTTRFSELQRMGVIGVVRTKLDNITKNPCDVWGITGNLPAKLKKKLTTQKKYNLALDFMIKHNINLEFSALLDKIVEEKNK